MQQKRTISEDVRKLRLNLEEYAKKAKDDPDDSIKQEWIESEYWAHYMCSERKKLYKSFSDEELLDILRNAAVDLGRAPYQKEIFCVYRIYIRRRFTNWPRALRAAGLKEPKIRHKDNEEDTQ